MALLCLISFFLKRNCLFRFERSMVSRSRRVIWPKPVKTIFFTVTRNMINMEYSIDTLFKDLRSSHPIPPAPTSKTLVSDSFAQSSGPRMACAWVDREVLRAPLILDVSILRKVVGYSVLENGLEDVNPLFYWRPTDELKDQVKAHPAQIQRRLRPWHKISRSRVNVTRLRRHATSQKFQITFQVEPSQAM